MREQPSEWAEPILTKLGYRGRSGQTAFSLSVKTNIRVSDAVVVTVNSETSENASFGVSEEYSASFRRGVRQESWGRQSHKNTTDGAKLALGGDT